MQEMLRNGSPRFGVMKLPGQADVGRLWSALFRSSVAANVLGVTAEPVTAPGHGNQGHYPLGAGKVQRR